MLYQLKAAAHRRLAQEPRKHCGGDRFGATGVERFDEPIARGTLVGIVGWRLRVGQDEARYAVGCAPRDGKRHVAAERQAAHAGVSHLERIKQRHDIVRVIVEGGRVLIVIVGPAEAREVGGDEPPAVGHRRELGLPHPR